MELFQFMVCSKYFKYLILLDLLTNYELSNRLRMNGDKTQLVWLGTRQQVVKLTTTELPLRTKA